MRPVGAPQRAARIVRNQGRDRAGEVVPRVTGRVEPVASTPEYGADLAVVSPWTPTRFEREDRLVGLLEGSKRVKRDSGGGGGGGGGGGRAAGAGPTHTPSASAPPPREAAADWTVPDVVDRTFLHLVVTTRFAHLDEAQQQHMVIALYSLLASSRSDDELQSELLDLLGLDAVDAVLVMLQHRTTIIDAVGAALVENGPLAGSASGSGATGQVYGAQVTVQTETEKRLSKVGASGRDGHPLGTRPLCLRPR